MKGVQLYRGLLQPAASRQATKVIGTGANNAYFIFSYPCKHFSSESNHSSGGNRGSDNRNDRRKQSNRVPTEQSEPRDPTLKKSRVAIICGYKGTEYNGLQYNNHPGCKTVEEVLEKALFDIGCISASNHGDISKIGWGRSSRTDKGVHAARVVISAKLQFNPDLLVDNFRVPEIVTRLNAILPADIRVFSCCRVSSGFRPRRLCNWRYSTHGIFLYSSRRSRVVYHQYILTISTIIECREYEYLLPVNMLRSDYAPRAAGDVVLANGETTDSFQAHNYLNWNFMENAYDSTAIGMKVYKIYFTDSLLGYLMFIIKILLHFRPILSLRMN